MNENETVQDVFDTLSEKQKNAVYAIIEALIEDEEMAQSDILQHFGVLGMKWGRRSGGSDRSSGGGSRPVKGLGKEGTKYTFKKEGRKTVVRDATGRKLSDSQKKKFMASYKKVQKQRMADYQRKANTVAAVGTVLGVVGAVALWKYAPR